MNSTRALFRVAACLLLLLPAPLRAQVSVSFPSGEGGLVSADFYGDTDRAVVLVHGGRFDRTSWGPQARRLAAAGFRVLAIDLPGRGRSVAPEGKSPEEGSPLAVLAAVRYLRGHGATDVSVIGASLGGWAAGEAMIRAEPGEIDALVLLAASPVEEPERLGGRKLFLTSRDDTTGAGTRRLTWIQEQYDRAPDPKELVILEGAAHAQLLFETERGERAMAEILHFLSDDRAGIPSPRTVVVDGHAMRVQAAGLENRGPGSPVVVFEAGATQSLDAWEDVLPDVAGIAPVVAYDRSGLGGSGWDGQAPTPRHVAGKLRRLLSAIGADPPYVLVGHSWGGSLVRYFAGYHPGEVAGIVYVDPGPIVTQSVADELAPFEEIGAGREGYEAFWSGYAALFERASLAVRAEFEVYRGLMEREVADRDLRAAPAVPVVVILAAKPYPPLPGLPYDPEAHFQADLRHRIRMLQEWALASPLGTLVVSNHTTHAVPREDPGLIMWSVARVLAAIR